ncbi:unnamed protein product [Bursaphelenchus xylophilus]|uniref:(pine wood nematode) hypothetical protein n=1 Tax=Bursaphelenchus xylophilus TaxID=6326 RepID=A0A1I7S3R3_BURXY|nr:unnamed protein product [Bursaphelenchus xylophilus]CAG9116479.1 unnamed protein product [Bursaphelenchus xylophilus]
MYRLAQRWIGTEDLPDITNVVVALLSIISILWNLIVCGNRKNKENPTEQTLEEKKRKHKKRHRDHGSDRKKTKKSEKRGKNRKRGPSHKVKDVDKSAVIFLSSSNQSLSQFVPEKSEKSKKLEDEMNVKLSEKKGGHALVDEDSSLKSTSQSAANAPKPKTQVYDDKQELIKAGRVAKKGDYPTMDDIKSDWEATVNKEDNGATIEKKERTNE